MDKFLGRTFNEKNMTWEHSDGSGKTWTEEERQELYNNPNLAKKFEIEERTPTCFPLRETNSLN